MRRFVAGALLMMVMGACLSGEPADHTATITGRLVSGPTCPVETSPPDPECASRAVPDAGIVVALVDGTEIESRSELDGTFRIALPPGTFTITFDPVEGLMSPPEPISESVEAGQELDFSDVSYDTGVR